VRDPLWGQAIRLARALEYANAAGNTEAAKIHHAALLETLKQLGEIHGKDTEARRRPEECERKEKPDGESGDAGGDA
tara:strand:- start:6419 stop:6649 length:231 start_codon:yes stop_codon:yes gene_type:complete